MLPHGRDSIDATTFGHCGVTLFQRYCCHAGRDSSDVNLSPNPLDFTAGLGILVGLRNRFLHRQVLGIVVIGRGP